jgi:FkbM family methyltransferase
VKLLRLADKLKIQIEDPKIKNLVFWGAGRQLDYFTKKYCDEYGLLRKPDFICESTRDISENTINGIPVIKVDELRNLHAKETLIIVTAGILELYGQVIKNELYYHRIIHRRSLEILVALPNYIEEIKLNLLQFEDDESRDIYTKNLENTILGNFWDTEHYSYPPYFSNQLVPDLKNDQIVVFAGAFNGKHIENMLSNNSNCSIEAFEPTKIWFEYLEKKFNTDKRINIRNAVLWENETVLNFDETSDTLGLDAHIDLEGHQGVKVPSFSIDGLFLGSKVQQIILDVEGTEQKVILGARNLIRTQLPIITICIYHNIDDYVKIIPLIKEISEDKYIYFLRQHSSISIIETVLYAIPKK